MPPDVSASVSSLVAAFTTGLDVFKKLRAKRRRRKSSSNSGGTKQADEARLAASLSRGPVDIQRHYEHSYAATGEPFARGDAIAHASLTETLLKLNAGLVSIISAFLARGGSNSQTNNTTAARLDYRSLADLSDASRADAIAALGQLHARLAQSQLLLNRIRPRCSHCGSTAHVATCNGGGDCGSSTADLVPPPSSKRHGRRSRRSRAAPDGGASIALARVPKTSNGSQTRLVMLRPRGSRKPTAASSNLTELPPLLPEPPPPRQFQQQQQQQQQQQTAKPPPQPEKLPASPSLTRPGIPAAVAAAFAAPSIPQPRSRIRPIRAQPQPVPSTQPLNPASNNPKPKPKTHLPPPFPTTTSSALTTHLFPPPPSYRPPSPLQSQPQHQHQPPPPHPPLPPFSPPPLSLLSFTSDSTKLGEIPMRKWAVPFDTAEAERLNREAAESGYAVAAPPRVDVEGAEKGAGKVKGGWLGRLLGRGR
ncbi:uncharacterized protein K452DRAFT_306514 [Aplosporella prunicola CBS 121167]|uniref:Uncharacterized protein n=1 Tax=Aplosporella prunicola CBS 121167 TaxID=1176127 RepID=A0A6A6BMV9_9PEZI|nr:uncharacterized protein K452DRAFT_306514 [Aplosporella prunicola CBS 121167]KAF2144743.1 hypothetical protein K452DRAFT_306514 [Aplosporella prunicola CBS 121167]